MAVGGELHACSSTSAVTSPPGIRTRDYKETANNNDARNEGLLVSDAFAVAINTIGSFIQSRNMTSLIQTVLEKSYE